MTKLETLVLDEVKKGFEALFGPIPAKPEPRLQPTRKEFEGTYTFVTFPYTKLTKRNPVQMGEELGAHLKVHSTVIADFNVVKGFLNLVLEQGVWLGVYQEMLGDTDFGRLPRNGQRVMVEYSSPNTNKPLHLGHLRNNFLGYSIAGILDFAGYDVVKANLVNDRGIHICKSMVAYERFGNGETPASGNIKGDHLVGKYYVAYSQAYADEVKELIAKGMGKEEAEKEAPIHKAAQDMLKSWESGEEAVIALWKQMNGWVYEGFEATYKSIGVSFDQYYYESDTYLLGKDIVQEGLDKGVFYTKSDGSVWVDLTEEGLDNKLVLRSDGTSVYMTQDMGTADLKYKDHKVNYSIYVVGNEQDYHFKVLFAIMQKLGRSYAEHMYHLSYGMVELPSGKMKSREGKVVDADDLVTEMEETARIRTTELGKVDDFDEEEKRKLFHMLGMGALKYFLLRVDPKRRMLFNPDESIDFQGDTGPFIQYTHARIRSILRKAGEKGINVGGSPAATPGNIKAVEGSLLYLLQTLPAVVEESAAHYSPSVVAQYVYEVAKEYNRFYTECPILPEEEPELRLFRVGLSDLAARTIRKGMELIGVEVPERM